MATPTILDWRAGGASCRRAFVPADVIVVEPPESAVLSLEDARRHLKQDPWMGGNPAAPGELGHPDDPDIIDMVAAATGEIEGPNGWLGRAIMPQTLAVVLDRLEAVRLPMPPTLEVLSVEILDDAGDATLMDEAAWRLVPDAPHMRLEPAPLATWPASRAIVTFRAGYETPEGEPVNKELATIRSWVRMRLTDLYANGGTTSNLRTSPFAEFLLTNLRVRT